MIPRICTTGTVVCLASGPSLTADDVAYVRGKATVVAVNDAIRLAPWADVLVSVDQIWWARHYRAMRRFPGLKVRVNPSQQTMSRKPLGPKYCQRCQRRLTTMTSPCWCEGIVTCFNGGYTGVSFEPDTIVTTENSGGSAINVAVHLGAKLIVLLGYDMGTDKLGRRHFYDTEAVTVNSPFHKFRRLIGTMVQPLRDAGIEVVNCSRRTALEAFPCRPLREVL